MKPGGRYADGTIGGGGHAAAILAASAPNGWLFGCDRDGAAVEAAQARLAEFAGRFEIRRGEFCGIGGDAGAGKLRRRAAGSGRQFGATRHGGTRVQLSAGRPAGHADGHAAGRDGGGTGQQAAADELAKIFWELGGEPQARRLARAIESDRRQRPFTTTGQLAAIDRAAGAAARQEGRIRPRRFSRPCAWR